MNPRVIIWLRAAKLSPKILVRRSGEDLARVNGTPWTAVYMIWIQERWREWADGLGFRDHRVAQVSGHSADDFDAWLEKWEIG